MLKKFLKFILRHKIIAAIIIIALLGGGYWGYGKFIKGDATETRYVLATVEKGTLITSVSGSGQVSTLNQVEIKPKVSGQITLINIKNGQTVKEGDLFAQIDSRDAARKVSEAQSSLENAKLDLAELLAPVDQYTLTQAENSLADAQDTLTKLKTTQANNYQETLDSKEKAEENLKGAYEDAYNEIASVFDDLPDIMTGIYTVLYSHEIVDSELLTGQSTNKDALINAISDWDERVNFQEEYIDRADDDYKEAKIDYDQNFTDYKRATRYSERIVIEELLNQTLETTKKIADTVKKETNMFDWWVEYRTTNGLRIYSKVTAYQTNLSSYTSKTNSFLTNLLASQRAIENYQDDITQAERDLAEMKQSQPLELAAAERSLKEKQEKLNDLKAGATQLEIKNKQLTVQQKQNSLLEAQQNYANYFIRAPFEGVIAEVGIAKGDDVSSTITIATLITNQKIAEITLNEIDAAQVKTGQKVNLTFDAVEDLPITGQVAEITTIGTVSQGVVSYGVKIIFDVQDDRIKPGMSVSASIIIESKSDVLLAPISAVKIEGQTSYVEILVNGQPQSKTVVTGLASDTMAEIIEGLAEGEEIITQTISSSQNTSSTQNSNRRNGSNGGLFMMR